MSYLHCILLAGSMCIHGAADPGPRWSLDDDGGISWAVAEDSRLPHADNIEMSGRHVSAIVWYGVGPSGAGTVKRHIVWPMLRTIPNDTHASLAHDFENEIFPEIEIDGKPAGRGRVISVSHRGLMTVVTRFGKAIELTRVVFPSTTKPLVLDNCILRNTGKRTRTITIGEVLDTTTTPADKGVYGAYVIQARTLGSGEFTLAPGEAREFNLAFIARIDGDPEIEFDPRTEERARRDYVASLWDNLVFGCPDKVIERAFAFAKIRAAESIYETRGGLMHGPGGGSYYAAIWANDQAEYANPFFPYLGDAAGVESALNSFRHFARFMTPEYKAVPSSIIAEGKDIWNGAGDRGDAAMIAYGAGRFALSRGDRAIAEELWPSIEWCLEYCRRRLTDDGVVASDSDELENRFPSGDANLCTSSLAYDAMISAAFLAGELGKGDKVVAEYETRAKELRQNIERHFGAKVEGFDTYRYYDGNEVLRSWICIPLAVGIDERKEGTIDALFSPRLWTPDGLATQAGEKTFWDRSTLYGMRGVFAAGAKERCMPYFKAYSQRRLLEDHVPYPVEAFPEGNQRHLSAESALYCRVITEGMFGIRPIGLSAFSMQPRLPNDWDRMALRRVNGFGKVFDIDIERLDGRMRVRVNSQGKRLLDTEAAEGDVVTVRF